MPQAVGSQPLTVAAVAHVPIHIHILTTHARTEAGGKNIRNERIHARTCWY